MKIESPIFNFGVYSTDANGEKYEISFSLIKRTDLVLTFEKCGINLSWTYPYNAKGRKTYPITDIQAVEQALFCRFGEFKYNVHIWFERQ